jgi:hypothetical protein
MRVAEKCRTRALVFKELAKESPQLQEQCSAIADAWLTLAAIEDEFNSGVRHGHASGTSH